MSLALSLCQYVLRSRRGLAQASPSLKAPRLQAFEARDLLHQHNRKGQVVMIKTRRSKRLVFRFVFCTLNWYEFWRRSGGLPCTALMMDDSHEVWKFDALREPPLCKGEATCHSSSWHSFMHRRLVENIPLVAEETCALWSICVGLASADRLPVVDRIPAGPIGSLKVRPAERQRAPTTKKMCIVINLYHNILLVFGLITLWHPEMSLIN